MAEFCLKCWNEINEMNLNRFDVLLSSDLDLCEHCGKYKRVVVGFTPIGENKVKEYMNDKKNCSVELSFRYNIQCKLF